MIEFIIEISLILFFGGLSILWRWKDKQDQKARDIVELDPDTYEGLYPEKEGGG